MWDKNRRIRLCGIFWLAVFLMFTFQPAYAESDMRQTLKVGRFPYESQMVIDALATPLDNQLLPYEDFRAFDGLSVGVVKGNLQKEKFVQYSQDHNITPVLLSVLNKGLRNISTTEINQIVLSQVRGGQADSVAAFLYRHPVEIVALLSFIFIALIVTLSMLLFLGKRSSQKLHKMFYTDSLTGFPNYQALSLDSKTLVEKYPGQYALLYLDIHQFKVINDAFGYAIGDKVLIAISELLHQFVGAEERFARLYADTFLLLLKYESAEAIRERIHILSIQLEHLTFENLKMLKPIFCGGVYLLPTKFENLDEACDRANYAKDSISHPFSNTVTFYDDIIRDQILAEKELESSMSIALERGEFIPFYQPKVNAITGKVIGAEALVRWMHPEKGCLSPGEFLPFYEKNGFIVKIDLSIFEQVCQDLQKWIQSGSPIVPISVNFSRRNMRDKSLPQKLKDIADYYQIPSHLLEIEITETEELENMDIAMDFVDALKVFGFNISIDDYGTGYSSISFLQELPLDTLKLDRQFILNAMKTDKARDIMRYLITSMQKNEICILCEGIETDQQREFVVSLNCRYIQGYLYSMPLCKEDFEAYLIAHGAELTNHLDFISITNFDETRWEDANEFISRAMLSWIVCCVEEPDYPVQYISTNFLESMGYSELEFKVATDGRYINWVHPDDRQDLSTQYRLRKKDGSYVWIQEINKRVTAEGGQVVIIRICTDISALVSLQMENDRLIDTIPGGVGTLVFTPEGPIIQQATDRFYEVIGYTQEEMVVLENNLIRIFYHKDLADAMCMMQQIVEAGKQSCECVFRVRWKDESLHWITFRGAISRTETQISATVILHNSDEEIQAKQTVNIAQAKLELALAMTENAMFEYNIATETVYVHRGLGKYGVSDGTTTNILQVMNGGGIVHPDDIGNIQKAQAQIIAGAEHISYEVRIKSTQNEADSSYVWVRIALTTIFDEDGQPVRCVGITADINKQKHFEHAFQREIQYRRVFTELTLMAYEFNLTQNTIGRITGSRGFRLRQLCETLPQPDNYTEVLKTASEVLVCSEDRDMFFHTVSLDNLLRLYHDGIFETELEYRRITPEGQELWNSVLMYLFVDPLSNDIMGYSYHRDIQEQKAL